MARKTTLLVLAVFVCASWTPASTSATGQAVLRAAPTSPAPLDTPPGERIVRFPTNRAMGELFVHDWGSAGGWKPLGEARGNVVVPAGKGLLLWIRRTDSTDLSPLASLGPSDLEALDFQGLGLRDADLAHLEGLTLVQNLILADTQISDAGLAHLKGLTALKHLELKNTKVGDAGLAHVKHLPSLQYLSLSNTQVTDEGLAQIESMSSLCILQLTRTRISDAGLAHLSGLTSLQLLHLGNTAIGDAGLAHLDGLTSLTQLYLHNTRVTDAGLAHLKGLRSLRILSLSTPEVGVSGELHVLGLDWSGNRKILRSGITEEGIAELKKALPDCQIVK